MTSKRNSTAFTALSSGRLSVMNLQNILNDDERFGSLQASDEDSWPRPPIDKKETTLQKKAPEGPVHFWPHKIGNDPEMRKLFETHTVWPKRNLEAWTEFIPYNMEKNALKLGRNHLRGMLLSISGSEPD